MLLESTILKVAHKREIDVTVGEGVKVGDVVTEGVDPGVLVSV